MLGTCRFLPFSLPSSGALNDNRYEKGMAVLPTFHAVSATAGQLAKARLSRLVKLLEPALMTVALVGLTAYSLAGFFAAAMSSWAAAPVASAP